MECAFWVILGLAIGSSFFVIEALVYAVIGLWFKFWCGVPFMKTWHELSD